MSGLSAGDCRRRRAHDGPGRRGRDRHDHGAAQVTLAAPVAGGAGAASGRSVRNVFAIEHRALGAEVAEQLPSHGRCRSFPRPYELHEGDRAWVAAACRTGHEVACAADASPWPPRHGELWARPAALGAGEPGACRSDRRPEQSSRGVELGLSLVAEAGVALGSRANPAAGRRAQRRRGHRRALALRWASWPRGQTSRLIAVGRHSQLREPRRFTRGLPAAEERLLERLAERCQPGRQVLVNSTKPIATSSGRSWCGATST